MKRMIAGLITAATLTALFVTAAIRPRVPTDDTAEKCIDRMFVAMKDGDVTRYLDCFAGALRDQLDASVRQQGAAGFSQYLIATANPIKGRTVFRSDGPAADRVSLKVDRVYENRMWEFQIFHLERKSNGWKIAAIDPVELHDPPIPYGTPAAEEVERVDGGKGVEGVDYDGGR